MENHKQVIEEITLLFKEKKVHDLDTSIELINTQFQLLLDLFDTSEQDEEKSWACRYALLNLLPLTEKMLASPKVSESLVGKVYNVYRKTYAFVARRSLAHFIDYMEWDRSSHRKVYMNRKHILEPIVYYLNKLAFDDKLELVCYSIFPSGGKSFALNYYSAWLLGINPNDSILRMSYSEEVVTGFSRSIKDLVASDLFAEVFPDFALYKNRPFEKEKDSDWKIKNSDVITTHFARTRGSGVNGIRAKKLIAFDDLVKGKEEAYDDRIHENNWQQYLTEWSARKDNDSVKIVFAGTMWSPKDILNRVRENAEKKSKLVPSKLFKYAQETEDGHAVFIAIPLLDEKNRSTCENVYTTKKALELERETDPYLFSCVYQQKPIAPSGLEFAWGNLNTYEELPKNELLDYAYAVLDPTRKGKDNISMPICRLSKDGETHYVVDWVYKKKAMTEMYDEIVDKIIEHDIIHFEIENNTDTSLKSILEMKLKERKYSNCEIDEKYNTVKKEIRIKDARGLIIRKMVFKHKNMLRTNSDYARAMESFTTYSFDYANRNDDAPDSLSMYANRFILGIDVRAKVQVIDRKSLGF